MDNSKSHARRCAIYTRKSSEEGLEQDFNSLQAQREACEAFIKSQASEGWRLIKTAYDIGQNQDWGYIPLHQQALAWGASKKMKIVQRADNQILFYGFRKE